MNNERNERQVNLLIDAIGNIDEEMIAESCIAKKRVKLGHALSLVATLLILTLCLIPILSGLGGIIMTGGDKGEDNADLPSAPNYGDNADGVGGDYDYSQGTVYSKSNPLVITDCSAESDDADDGLPLRAGATAFYTTDGVRLYLLCPSDTVISGAAVDSSEQSAEGVLYEIVAESDFEISTDIYLVSFGKTDSGYTVLVKTQ